MKKKVFDFTKTSTGIISDQSLKEIIDGLSEGSYVLTISLASLVASPEQFGWYWVICSFLYKNTEVGMTKDEWHEYFSSGFLSEEKEKPIKHTIIKSITTLNKDEFTEYLSKILLLCETEPSINVPRKYLLPKIKGFDSIF